MKFKSTNRMVNGVDLIIRHPETGNIVEVEIDTDNESSFANKHFQRLHKSGDLEIVEVKTKTKSKGVE